MDKFQHKLRLLIVTGSAVGFISGWALLAHAGKPVSNTAALVEDTSFARVTAQATALEPLPPLDFAAIEAGRGTTSVQSLSSLPATQPVQVFRPRVRTRTS
jgi:hypothetical protein